MNAQSSVTKAVGNCDYIGRGYICYTNFDYQNKEGLDTQAEIDAKQEVGWTYADLGLAYDSIGDTRKAIKFLEIALEILQFTSEIINHGFKDYKSFESKHFFYGLYKNLEDLEKDILIAGRKCDLYEVGKAYIRVGKIYADRDMIQKSVEIFKEAVSVYRIIYMRSDPNFPRFPGQDVAKRIERKDDIDIIRFREMMNLYYQIDEIGKVCDLYDAYEHVCWAHRNYGMCLVFLGEEHLAIRELSAALDISRFVRNRNVEYILLSDLGSVSEYIGEFHKSIDHYEQALVIGKELNYVDDLSITNNLGNAYFHLGRRRKAISIFECCLKKSQEIGDQEMASSLLDRLAFVYLVIGEPGNSILYSEQALEIHKSVGYRDLQITLKENTEGEILQKKDSPESNDIPDYHKNGFEYHHRLYMGKTLSIIGTAFAIAGDTQKAINFFLQALSIHRKSKAEEDESITLGNLGLAWFQQSEEKEAISCMESALKLFEKMNSPYIGWARQYLLEWGEGAEIANIHTDSENL